MRRDVVELWSPELGWSPRVIAYGSYGRPVLVFPSSEGRAEDYESNGMVDAVRPLIDAGRVKVFCVNMNEAVEFMVKRGLPRRPEGSQIR